jgi:hypothetical protein
MTTYYSFHKGNDLPPMCHNNSNSFYSNQLPSIVSAHIQHELSSPTIPLTLTCTQPPPCQTWVQWKPQYKNLPVSYFSWKDITNGKIDQVEIGKKIPEIWNQDISSVQYQRSLVSGAEWWSESTGKHIHNRPLFTQYLYSSYYPKSSPHEKSIDHIGDSLAVLQHQIGENNIQYTSF